jgi:hypothetical protein
MFNKKQNSDFEKGLNSLERYFVFDYYLENKISKFDAGNYKQELSGTGDSIQFRSTVLEHCLGQQSELKSISINNLHFSGILNLNYHIITKPLIFKNCSFDSKILLNEAQTRSITFEQCLVKDIDGSNINIRGSLSFEKSKVDNAEIKFSGADINGSIIFSGADIHKPFGNVLNLDLAKCSGSMIFDNGFKSEGRISIIGARIQGSIDMHSANLSNANNTAITIANTFIDGNIFFTGNFNCVGRLSLMNSNIKGNLEIEQAKIQNPQQVAIHADALDCNGSIFIRGGSLINGEMRFPGVTVARVFEIRDSELYNRDRVLINAQGMIVKRTFEWKNFLKPPAGKIQFSTAKVEIYEDDESSWPATNELEINGFEYNLLGGNSPVEYAKRERWLGLQHIDKFHPQPYENLVKVLNSMGYETEATKIAILKHDKNAKEQKGYFNKLRNFLLKLTMDYGYNPGKIFKWFIIPYLIVGSIVFSYAEKNEVMMPTKDRVYITDEQKIARPKDYPKFNAIAYSIDTFIPFFDLNQETYWLPKSKYDSRFFFTLYLWVHVVSGWLLTSLAVIGYTGLIRKD